MTNELYNRLLINLFLTAINTNAIPIPPRVFKPQPIKCNCSRFGFTNGLASIVPPTFPIIAIIINDKINFKLILDDTSIFKPIEIKKNGTNNNIIEFSNNS